MAFAEKNDKHVMENIFYIAFFVRNVIKCFIEVWLINGVVKIDKLYFCKGER